MPQAAAKIASFFELKIGENLDWKNIGRAEGIGDVQITSEVLFAKLEDEQVETLRDKYSGSQKDRLGSKEETSAGQESVSLSGKPFSSVIDLRVAKIEIV
jgi:methionyl-tRNA synthetase